jgi:hypothetical protein
LKELLDAMSRMTGEPLVMLKMCGIELSLDEFVCDHFEVGVQFEGAWLFLERSFASAFEGHLLRLLQDEFEGHQLRLLGRGSGTDVADDIEPFEAVAKDCENVLILASFSDGASLCGGFSSDPWPCYGGGGYGPRTFFTIKNHRGVPAQKFVAHYVNWDRMSYPGDHGRAAGAFCYDMLRCIRRWRDFDTALFVGHDRPVTECFPLDQWEVWQVV